MNIRSLDLWDLVCWVYRDQKAHRYLRKKADWFDWAIDMTTHGEIDVNVPVHKDAAMVHAAVIGLGFMPSELIIQVASIGERPERSTVTPQAFPVPPADERMRATDRASWTEHRGRRVNYVIRSEEKVRVVDLIEKRARGKNRKPAVEENARMVDIEFVPIEWWPDPAYIDMVNGVHREWTEAMIALMLALQDTKLTHHRILGFAFEPLPSFEAPPDIGPARLDVSARIIRTEDVVEHLAGDGEEMHVVRLRRHVRTELILPAYLR